MGLHLLGCPEHEFTIFRKCLWGCVDVCNTNFVGAVTHELMVGISEILDLGGPLSNLDLIRFWCDSADRGCCSGAL